MGSDGRRENTTYSFRKMMADSRVRPNIGTDYTDNHGKNV